jgi:hypothetical protein
MDRAGFSQSPDGKSRTPWDQAAEPVAIQGHRESWVVFEGEAGDLITEIRRQV